MVLAPHVDASRVRAFFGEKQKVKEYKNTVIK